MRNLRITVDQCDPNAFLKEAKEWFQLACANLIASYNHLADGRIWTLKSTTHS